MVLKVAAPVLVVVAVVYSLRQRLEVVVVWDLMELVHLVAVVAAQVHRPLKLLERPAAADLVVPVVVLKMVETLVVVAAERLSAAHLVAAPLE